MPSIIATADESGLPNVTYLSQVFYVDDKRVALSCQFFNKTKQNVLKNPYACLQLYDPESCDAYRIEIRYHHEEFEGPLFDTMSARIDAIASHTGMKGIFKLRSADVYDVISVGKVEGFVTGAMAIDACAVDEPPMFRGELHALQQVCQRASRATDLEGLLNTVLETLDEALGFQHSMVLLHERERGRDRLFAIASHGYGEAGIGAEINVGDGLIGTVARERRLLRVSGVGAELRYGRAIRASVSRAGGALAPEIPLPGLVDAQSQLAIPLVAGDRLVGVLAVESRAPGMFEEWHEAFLEVVASQFAFGIENMIKRERDADAEAQTETRAPDRPSAVPVPSTKTRRLKFFPSDDCVFVDDEYLVRNLPGRILWKLLREHDKTGRTEFTNRELRLDASLGLPAIRDNLESRLVLLRKRLEQKCPDIALVTTGRGQFRLELRCAVTLEEMPP
jgi:adenylate cyclase